MHNGQFARHRQDRSLTSGVGQLRRGGTHQSHHTGRVDDASLLLSVLAERLDRVLAAIPHPLDIDVHGQIPDRLGGLLRIAILRMHDSRIVEHDIQTTPGIEVSHGGLNLTLLGDIHRASLHIAIALGNDLVHPGESLFEPGGTDISHENGGAFAKHEDGSFETDATKQLF